jgi:outer membrane protein OmpA-like peptidoglycan-associated protein
MQRSKIPYLFLGLAAVLALAAVALLILRPGVHPDVPPPDAPPAPRQETTTKDATTAALDAAAEPIPEPDPETALEVLVPSLSARSPEELVGKFAQAFEAGDIATLGKMLSDNHAQPDAIARLEALAGRTRLLEAAREVGEIELNKRSRWALRLAGAEPGRDRIALDLVREGGEWKIERIILPPDEGAEAPRADPLEVADAFIQSLIVQELEFARSLADPAAISDAKLAGLCIIFEEGGYRMRPTKPLRTMFQREDATGFLATVEAVEGKETAQFSLTLGRASADADWRVSEINLDQLLADYSRRMAGGDIYYSPLVKNPAGGDTLALYFAFDEAEMSPRTRRQLEIVAMMLMTDPGKRINLSGHTDALGTDAYNRQLSADRAQVVRKFLIESGVDAEQIVTAAKGASQPRRPNFTETGEDNPQGRRANRRTEIYLDF